MPMQTKLVDCGSTVFIYDFESSRSNYKDFEFEREGMTHIERLILTNFSDDRLLASFSIQLALNAYNQIDSTINLFLSKLGEDIGRKNIKFLAVLEAPTASNSFIHITTDVEIDELVNGDMEDNEEEYLEKLWGDKVDMNVYSINNLLDKFINTYKQTLENGSPLSNQRLIYNDLKKPRILRNEEASDFISKHKVLDYPEHNSTEIYDKSYGFVTVNEYSLNITSSITDEFDFFF